jgi:hypothetical protein
MTRFRTFGLILLLSGLSATGFLWASQRTHGLGFPLDDAWIHQTYARNLVQRGEWSFTAGQPSAGSTSPLWTAALALGRWLRIEPLAWTYGLGVLLLAVLGWVCGRWLALRQPARQTWALVAGAGVVLEWHLVWASLSGMETLALALVVVLVLWSLESGRPGPLGLGLLIGVGTWIRPDALSLVIPVGLGIVAASGRRLRSLLRDLFLVMLGAGLLLAPYLAFNFRLSGEWWPSTFYAKQAEYAVLRQAPVLERLLAQARGPLVGAGAVLALGAVLTVWREARARTWARLVPLIWVTAYLCAYAIRLPVTYQHARYAMPTIPVLAVVGLDGMFRWIQLATARPLRRILSRTWLATLGAVTAAFWLLGCRAYAQDVAIIETEMVEAARWIAVNTEPEALVAAHDIGALGYFGNRPLLDLAGLVSPEVIPILRDEAALAQYLDRHNAEYLMTFPGWYPLLASLAQPLHVSTGGFSPAAGGENMVVYRWRSAPFARQGVAVLYFSQSSAGGVDHGNHRGHNR